MGQHNVRFYNKGRVENFIIGGAEIYPKWERGTINTKNGQLKDSKKRIRTKDFIDIWTTGAIIKTCFKKNENNNKKDSETVGVCPIFYNKNKVYQKAPFLNKYVTEYIIQPKTYRYMKLVMKLGSDDSDKNKIIIEEEDGNTNCIIRPRFYDSRWDTNLQGKKLIYIGDSIPHGQSSKGDIPIPYPQIVATYLGMDLVNYAIGGSTLACKTNYGGAFKNKTEFDAARKNTSKRYDYYIAQQRMACNKYKDGIWYIYDKSEIKNVKNVKKQWDYKERTRTPICKRIKLAEKGDYIVIAAGTNDFQYNWTPIGKKTSKVDTQFYGALNNICDYLINEAGYNKKHIIFCTPIKRAQDPYELPTDKNENGKTLEEYGKMIIEICKKWGVQYLDLYKLGPLNPATQPQLFDFYKTHPLQVGHDRLGLVVAYLIQKLLLE